jgi:hypothetical protein
MTDADMAAWWTGLTTAEMDEWCRALAANDVSAPLGNTIAAGRRDGGRDAWLSPIDNRPGQSVSGSFIIEAGLRAFLETRCETGAHD